MRPDGTESLQNAAIGYSTFTKKRRSRVIVCFQSSTSVFVPSGRMKGRRIDVSWYDKGRQKKLLQGRHSATKFHRHVQAMFALTKMIEVRLANQKYAAAENGSKPFNASLSFRAAVENGSKPSNASLCFRVAVKNGSKPSNVSLCFRTAVENGSKPSNASVLQSCRGE